MEEQGQIVTLFSLSDTMPVIPDKVIQRDPYMKIFEEQLKDNDALFIDAEEGTGVTTTLALFAQQHPMNCISYFNNGLVKALLAPEIIEESLLRQLLFYVDGIILNDGYQRNYELKALYLKISRKLRRSQEPLYFIFDGFNRIPRESADNIKMVMDNLPWRAAKFIFSGQYDDIKDFLPKNVKRVPDQNLICFSSYEVKQYFRQYEPDLTEEECNILYTISGGKGSQIQAMVNEFKKKNSFKPILDYEEQDSADIYNYNFRIIESSPECKEAIKLLALIAFCEIKLSNKQITNILKEDIEKIDSLIVLCSDYLVCRDNIVSFNNETNHKFIRTKLKNLKHDIEVILVQAFQNVEDNSEIFSYVPVLYRSLNDKKGLVKYLNSSTVQKIMENNQSQAALNEQCEFGYNACDLSNDIQVADAFRFAIYKSTSREIEKGELWDYQIEAMIAVGMYENAYALAQTVYLKEEKLKSLLLIVRHKCKVPSDIIDSIGNDIDHLLEEIDFEHIPEKSMELAKLLFPYNFAKAVDIIDRVAKVTQSHLPIDRFYSILSMSTGQEMAGSNQFNYDIVDSKIEDEEIRRITKAMRNLFDNSDISQVIAELEKLPTPQQRMHLLRYWIPGHDHMQNIGIVVKYAISTVISVSNMDVPKSSLVTDFCKPLPKMNPFDVDQVIVMIDSIKKTLITPSKDYVRLELIVIKALYKYDIERAGDRLMNLYLHVLSLGDKSTEISCKSIILSKLDGLGNKKHVEKALSAAPYNLQKEIENDIEILFSDTAYHFEIADQTIRALSTCYPSTVEFVIQKMNTKERQSWAYRVAVLSYIENTDVDKINWNHLNKWISGITYNSFDKNDIAGNLVYNICHVNTVTTSMIENVKSQKDLFFNVERSSEKCYVLSNLYVWFIKHAPNDSFTSVLKTELFKTWNQIRLPWNKVDIGFSIAKNLAKISIEEAKHIVEESNRLQDKNLLTSSSCVNSYLASLDLYVKSLGLLIRTDACEESYYNQFADVIDNIDCEGEAIIHWSKIALEYLLSGNKKKFDEICSQRVHKSLSGYSEYYRKKILYNITPALYFYAKDYFYSTLECEDEFFRNICLEAVVKFIFFKYPYPEYYSDTNRAFPLSYSDCDDILNIMPHLTDDGIIFNVCNCLCVSIKENKSNISSEQKSYITKKLCEIVDRLLPSPSGIQHDGYKLACHISINSLEMSNQSQKDIQKIKDDIEQIPNLADRCFLYVHAAHYLKKAENRKEFIEKAVFEASGIGSIYDRTNRLDMSISESISTTKGIAKDVATKAMKILCEDENGQLKDYKRLVDLVYQIDPRMADQLIDDLDKDEARINFKRQLLEHIQKTKKVDEASNSFSVIGKMNYQEQQAYFSKQLENQVNKQFTPRNINETMVVIQKIYDYPIQKTRDAVMFFLENIYQKHQITKRQKGLLQSTHQAILSNLKIVLSLSSGTKEKWNRINLAISENYRQPHPSFMKAGEYDKSVEYIKNWYTNNPYDDLMIMDAYFSPNDLYIVKELMNINANLSVTILTHHKSAPDINEFQPGWDKVSSDLPGSIKIYTVCFEDKPDMGPLHARWWLCTNRDEDLTVGIKLTSVSGLGKKDEDIETIPDDKIPDIQKLFIDYTFFNKRKVDDKYLVYDKIELK